MSIHINLMVNKEHFSMFCAAMNKLFMCRSPHCDATCWARALISVQGNCNKGMTIDSAAKKWATTGLTHENGKEIMADLLKVDNLDTVRDLLREESIPEEGGQHEK